MRIRPDRIGERLGVLGQDAAFRGFAPAVDLEQALHRLHARRGGAFVDLGGEPFAVERLDEVRLADDRLHFVGLQRPDEMKARRVTERRGE